MQHEVIHPHNPIRKKIEGLDALINLEELWLGKNKITRLEVRYPLSL